MDTLRQTATALQAIGEPTRLRMMALFAGGPKTPTMISDATGIPIVNVSHHLGVLRTAGILQSEKRGRCIEYSIVPETVAAVRANGEGVTLHVGEVDVVIPVDVSGTNGTTVQANGEANEGKKKKRK